MRTGPEVHYDLTSSTSLVTNGAETATMWFGEAARLHLGTELTIVRDWEMYASLAK